MTNATTPTIDEVLLLANRLSRHSRAELVARLVRELADVSATHTESDDSLNELEQLIATADHDGPADIDSAELLHTMRR